MVASLSAVALPVYSKQQEFLEATTWLRGLCAGRGCGKTTVACDDILLKAKDGEPYMSVSPTYPDVAITTWPTFEARARTLGVWLRGVWSPIPRAWFRTRDGGKASITFKTAEAPPHGKPGDNLRGPSMAGLWYDEPSVMHHGVFQIGIGILRHRGRMGRCTMTFTPKGRRHWTYGVFYERMGEEDVARSNATLVRAHTLDNPFLPDEFYDSLRGQYTSALAAQELAGEFVDLEGLLFKREWFQLFDRVPRLADRVRYWDKAATPGSGCYTAGILIARDKSGLGWVEDVVRGQWSAHDRDRIICETAADDARKYGNQVLIFIEQEPGSGGKESMQQSIRMLAGFPIRRDVVSRGKRERVMAGEKFPGEAKVVRAQPFAAQAEAGNIRVKRASWTADFLEELTAFPESKHADQVDAASGAWNKLCMMFALGGNMTPTRSDAPEPDPIERYGVQVATNGGRAGGWFKR